MRTRGEVLGAYLAAHSALHKLWTDAVGTPGYNKYWWKQIANGLDLVAREAATAAGHPPEAPLL